MESRATWARSRSSASSASVTRTPIVRVRRSDSPSRGRSLAEERVLGLTARGKSLPWAQSALFRARMPV